MASYVQRLHDLEGRVQHLDRKMQPHRDALDRLEREQMDAEAEMEEVRKEARAAVGFPALKLSNQQLAREALALFGAEVIDMASDRWAMDDG